MPRSWNKKGFTLMELMVYIAILGVIVLIVGHAFSDSTKFRIRTQNMLNANETSERVVAMFSDDVAQMGAKTYKTAGDASNPDRFHLVSDVYMDASATDPDSSSYTLNDERDNLTIRRVRYAADGKFEAVEEVTWFKRDKSLYRTCVSKNMEVDATAPDDCPSDNPPEVEIASNVDVFEITVAKPNVTSDVDKSAAEKAIVLPVTTGLTTRPFRLVPRFYLTAVQNADIKVLTVSPEQGGLTQTLSGFEGNYNMTSLTPNASDKSMFQAYVAKANTGVAVQDGEYWKSLCSKVTLDSASEYEIAFEIPYTPDNSRLFCPGRDHAAVGFRNLDGDQVDGLDDFMFYAPSSNMEPEKRTFRFNVRHTVKNVCLAFTFASYSPAPGGKISIKNLIFKKVESANYNFEDATYKPAVADKQNVKALQLHLVVNRGGETSDITQVVPTPSNGPRD